MPAQPSDTSRAPPSASTTAPVRLELTAELGYAGRGPAAVPGRELRPGGRKPLVDVFRALMAQAQIDPEFRERFCAVDHRVLELWRRSLSLVDHPEID